MSQKKNICSPHPQFQSRSICVLGKVKYDLVLMCNSIVGQVTETTPVCFI
jgi:hypothetical protein